MKRLNFLNKSLHAVVCVGCLALCSVIGSASETESSNATGEDKNLKTRLEVTASGDTVIHYYYEPFDFGEFYNYDRNQKAKVSPNNVRRSSISQQSGNSNISVGTVNTGNHVGKIAFSESVTPIGGKIVSVPVMSAKVPGSAPQVALVYNSQGGNSVAGYGWGISGLSSITLTNKNHYYDGKVEAPDLYKPDECVFALNGTRLVTVSESKIPDYQYVTAQGFIYVKKIQSGNSIAYFEALYPDGSKATFGFKNNTSTQLSYPVTSIVDIKGYRVDFAYTFSGNNYYIKSITYGSKGTAHPAEITFDYEDRTDFTTVYASGQTITSSKLLKTIVSKRDAQELRTYALSHTLTGDVNRLTKIDCSVGTSHLNPLTFAYNYYFGEEAEGELCEESSAFISTYFTNSPSNHIQYIRGKFLKDSYGDGMIIYPGKFSTYGLVRTYKFLGEVRAMEYGSLYPANQEILIVPNVRFWNNPISIVAESGFQSINATDINGDGVDEVVKVNFNGLEGSKTILKITVYSFNSDSSYQTRTFDVKVEGYINSGNRLYSPVSRDYYWGNFNGDGKNHLLTVSHNKIFNGEDRESYFGLVDISGGKVLSESKLFSYSIGDMVCTHAIDIDGDGKTEFCHAENSHYKSYKLSNNAFTEGRTYTNFWNSKFNQPYQITDLNGDGKIDFVFYPAESYQQIEIVNIPVGVPQFCPHCSKEYPLLTEADESCRHCGNYIEPNVREDINSSNDYCVDCHSPLVWRMYDANSGSEENKLWCSNHGFSVPTVIDFGSEDKDTNWTVYLNTGKGFIETKQNIISRESGDKFTFIDVNKDGLADMIKVHKSEAELYLNKNGVLNSSPCGNPIAMQEGLSDFIAMNISNPLIDGSVICVKDGQIYVYDFSRDASKANLLTTITDSHGVMYSTEYADMTQGGNYITSETPRHYPYVQTMIPLNLVSNTRVTLFDSYNDVSNINYTYKGAVMHMQGLGFCGFEKTSTYDVLQKMHSEEIRNPEMSGVTTKVISPVKEVMYTYKRNKYINGQENIQLTSSTELDKLTQVNTGTSYRYDSYGNPTAINQYIGGEITTETTQTYLTSLTTERFIGGLPLIKSVMRGRLSSGLNASGSNMPNDRTEISAGNGSLPSSNSERERAIDDSLDNIISYPVIVGEAWIDKVEISYDPSTYLPISKKTYTGSLGDNKIEETRWTYDSYGNVTSEKSAPFDVTEFLGTIYSYDADGRNLESSTNAMGQTITYSNFDKYGNAQTVTDHKGRVSTITYDDWGAQISSTSPSGLTESVTTAWGGKGLYTITKTTTGKPTSIVHYDAVGREIRKGNQRFDGKWQYVDNAYDSQGRLEKVTLPFRGNEPTYWNSYSYDKYNRPVQITEASGKISTWSYNGLRITETKNGITSTKTRDASGAVISVSDEGGEIKYCLRPDGQYSFIIAPGEVKTEFEYDKYGRQTAIIDPSAGRQTYSESYASDGSKIATVTDANGKTVTTKSDKYGRVISITRPEFNTTYTYDEDGRLSKEASTNGTSVTYTYDSYDRPLTVREAGLNAVWLKKSFSYTDGNVASVKYENRREVIGTEQFTYTNGYNTEITLNGTIPVWKLTAENDFGQPTESVTGSLTRTYGYTEFGMPTQRKVGSIQNFSYDFDVTTGNLNSRTDSTRGLVENFRYDALNRLIGIGDKTIAYAENGNIMSMPGIGTLSYDISDRPYQVSMLTLDGTVASLRDQNVTYTSFKRPSTIEEDDKKATFTYNAAGDRVKMLVAKNNQILLSRHYIGKQYEYDMPEPTAPGPDVEIGPIDPANPPAIAESDTPAEEADGIMPLGLAQIETQLPDYGQHRLYLGGDAYSAPAVYVKEDDTWRLYFICRDYLGSITHIVHANGRLVAEYSYDAWGRLRNPETQEVYESGMEPTLFLGRGYTGHEHLPWFGLINMNARLYDPALGRFLAPDPYVQAPDFTQNFNRYSYCLNNPNAYVDENGEFIFTALLTPIGCTALGVVIDGACWGALIGGATYTAGVAFSKEGFDNWSWQGLCNAMFNGAVSGAVFAGMGLMAPSFVTPSTRFLANLPTYLGKAGYAALTGALSSGSAMFTNDLLDNGKIDTSFKDYMVTMGVGAGMSGFLSFSKSLYDFNTWDKFTLEERKIKLSTMYGIQIDFDESINAYAEFNSNRGRMFLKMRRECLNSKAFALTTMEHEMQHVDDLMQNPRIYIETKSKGMADIIFRNYSEPKAYARELSLANKFGLSMNNWIKVAEMANIYEAPSSVYYNFNLLMILRNIF